MIICKKCGFNCDDGSRFCTECATKLQPNAKVENKFISNTKILLAEGEVNVKSYHCTTFPNNAITRFLSLATDGYISITNQRVIFYGDGHTGSVLSSEVDIAKVTGIRSYMGRGWNLLALLVWMIIYVFQLGFITSNFAMLKYDFSFTGIILLIIGIALFVLALRIGYIFIRPWIYDFTVSGDGVQITPVTVGNSHVTLHWWVTGQGAANSMVSFLPGPDNQKAMREVGAVVKDLQTLGEHAIEKWVDGNRSTANNESSNTIDENNTNAPESGAESNFFA